MTRTRSVQIAVAVASVALFVESVRLIGVAEVPAALSRLGSGFAIVLLLGGVREAVRALAWTQAVDAGGRLGFRNALRARLAGEAVNALLPMGMVVGEPLKASQVGGELPFASAFKALAIEFVFYTASLVFLFAAGLWAFAVVSGIHLGAPALVAASTALAAATVVVMRRRPFLAAKPLHIVVLIAACEIAYQFLSLFETYYTLTLIEPERPTLAAALALETVSRLVTMAFKIVPMRIGVDEASSLFVAARIGVNPAAGVTLALVRKLRTLAWSAVGLVFLFRRSARAAEPVIVRGSFVVPALAILVLAAPHIGLAQEAPTAIAGSVSVAGPGGAPFVIPGVTITLTCPGSDPRVAASNDAGEFQFADVTARAACSIVAELQGFKSALVMVVPRAGETVPIKLELGLDTLHEDVTVHASAHLSDDGSIGPRVDRVTAATLQTAPIVSARFQEALPLIPGVVRGPDGLLNINGARSNQSAVTFNDANGTDPVTGEDAVELPIDAVDSVQVRGAAYAPEFGLSSGAITTIDTARAGDSWDVTLNDLEPRLRRRGGEFRGIESWTPRATFSVKASVLAPHAADETVKMTIPIRKRRLRPYRSASEPAVRTQVARPSA